ncbi:cation:proton antiporter domain-containing protein [Nocardioides nitrophenolicus]|uniref:cation:proton antiporter domain-containing protein n=1 Tax=Nocardioides nitrophenolicus TaxID=60489 RepID=UPI0019586EF0|nr:cation:proton antiporter [Nocardioides nitrophenolicus]MBM7515762.1 Kef-type K+ transport system membrane component KefB [Nocardioides nitrophenolicus]
MLDFAVLLALLALIIVVARLAGAAVARIGIPPVVGEIAAGVLLGPSLLGVQLSQDLFPVDQRGFLDVLARVGLVLFMFVVGLELDLSLVRGREKVAVSVSLTSIALPFALGIGLAHLFVSSGATEALKPADAEFWPFALFMGAAMSITAFPVLARILTDRRMHRTETGGLALACAATDDIIAWTLLAVVLAIAGVDAGHGHLPAWAIYLAVPFVAVAVFVVRPALSGLTRAYQRAGELTPTILSVVLVGMLLFSATTEVLGIHYIFGAFLFGAIIPHENAAALRHEILVRLEQISVLLLLPVFFLLSGLKVDIRGLGTEHIVPMLGILAVAIVGKYVGAYVGARLQQVPHWQASSLGLLMNTRGLTELIILNVGLEKGLLSQELFTMMVVMALVTTVMTGPLLSFVYPQRRVARDIAEAERAALGAEAVDRILVLARDGQDNRLPVELAVAALAGARPAEIVLADLTPQGRPLEVGSGLSLDLAEMAAAMERQQVLVHLGEELGVPVRVIAHPSADVEQDLVELVGALAPQGLVAWSDDPSLAAVVAANESPVVVVAAGTTPPAPDAPVVVDWAPGSDGEAAVVHGARVALARGATLALRGEGGRRQAAVRSALEARGVRFADPAADAGPLAAVPLEVGAFGGGAAVRVRAELDAAPVDFGAVPLAAEAVV